MRINSDRRLDAHISSSVCGKLGPWTWIVGSDKHYPPPDRKRHFNPVFNIMRTLLAGRPAIHFKWSERPGKVTIVINDDAAGPELVRIFATIFVVPRFAKSVPHFMLNQFSIIVAGEILISNHELAECARGGDGAVAW